MFSFEPLEQILTMDFSQLRKNKGCATDEAMDFFVLCLNNFFTQLKSNAPSDEENSVFQEKMRMIIEKINEIEVHYFREKFKIDFCDETPETIEFMAQATRLQNYEKLPTIMQYWARRGSWGDSIHKPEAHIAAIKGIAAWPFPPPPSKPKLSAIIGATFFTHPSAEVLTHHCLAIKP